MPKEELKNKISMTLKDPILQIGFEIICKENAELKTKVTALENANKAMVKELDAMTSCGLGVLENVVRSKEQLTKAKELIEDMYYQIPASHYDYYKDVMDRVKQFLEEVEE